MSKEADRVLELQQEVSVHGNLPILEWNPAVQYELEKEILDLAPALARRVKELEAERDKLHEALSRCRGQWIHSIHRDRCLEAIGEKETPK